MANMRLDNARDAEQIRRMEVLASRGDCHFCGSDEEFVRKHTAPKIRSGDHWFIVKNDFPYPGSVHHYLIVSMRHITRLEETKIGARLELFAAIAWLESHLKVTGESIFVRTGDMSYTGATLDHLHFHFLVGEKKTNETEWLTVTLGYKK